MASPEHPELALSPREARFERARRRVGLWLGPGLFCLCLGFSWAGAGTKQNSLLAVLLWVLVWWITEPVPLPVTALWGPTLAAMLGVDTPQALFAPFGDPVIFLFLGSFALAQGVVESGLDRRAALAVLSLRWVQRSRRRLLWACGALVAGMSMWLSNTATTAMMYPLVLAVARAVAPSGRSPFVTALLLTTAYGASIGGLGTPVGTPPNLIAIGQLDKLAGVKVGFLPWMGVGVPVMLWMLAFSLWYLGLRGAAGGKDHGLPTFAAQKQQLGPMSSREKNVLGAFALAVFLWLAPGVASLLSPGHPVAQALGRALPEGVVALLAASLLFLLPADAAGSRPTLTWREASQLDWGTLLLFGGGLSLGHQLFQSGLAGKLGQGLLAVTGAKSTLALAYLFAAVALLLTETTSNTAAATVVCPLAIAASQAAGTSPVAPAMAAAVAASLAFMLPVSTPPNAIVYGSGLVRVTTMLRHGTLLDLFGLCTIPPLVVALCHLWGLS